MTSPTAPDVFSRTTVAPLVTGALRAAAQAARTMVAARGDAQAEHFSTAAMTHSWLFTGPPGSGRSVAAKTFAAALVCTDSNVVGCGTCKACTTALADAHPDITHIIPTELSISVATMRAVIRDAATMPTTANWRVVIIEDADRLSEGAANALLKTVEEPPEKTVIMLCSPSTDPQDISVTLRSRCRHIYVPTPSIDDVARVLTADGQIPDQIARLAAATTACHIGRARHLATSPTAQQRREEVLKLAEDVYRGSAAFRKATVLVKAVQKDAEESLQDKEQKELDKLATAMGSGATKGGRNKQVRGLATEQKALQDKQKLRRTRFQRDAIDLAMIDLAGLYRDALMTAVGADVDLIHPDKKSVTVELARRNEPAALVACLDAVSGCREALGRNVPPTVALDGMIGRLRMACRAE